MITTITPLRRVAVTLVLAGATAFGAVAVAPAAFADEVSTVTESAPEVVAPEVAPAPEVTPAPVVEAPAPVVEAPAPVVTPPPVVIGKDGKPVKAPKACTDKALADFQTKLAKATTQAAQLEKTADALRQVSAALRAQAVKMSPLSARITLALANAGDLAANKLDAQAQDLITKANVIDCIVATVPGGRF
jgi:hypothetical protein